jgi:hypothetical protein
LRHAPERLRDLGLVQALLLQERAFAVLGRGGHLRVSQERHRVRHHLLPRRPGGFGLRHASGGGPGTPQGRGQAVVIVHRDARRSEERGMDERRDGDLETEKKMRYDDMRVCFWVRLNDSAATPTPRKSG